MFNGFQQKHLLYTMKSLNLAKIQQLLIMSNNNLIIFNGATGSNKNSLVFNRIIQGILKEASLKNISLAVSQRILGAKKIFNFSMCYRTSHSTSFQGFSIFSFQENLKKDPEHQFLWVFCEKNTQKMQRKSKKEHENNLYKPP